MDSLCSSSVGWAMGLTCNEVSLYLPSSSAWNSAVSLLYLSRSCYQPVQWWGN